MTEPDGSYVITEIRADQIVPGDTIVHPIEGDLVEVLTVEHQDQDAYKLVKMQLRHQQDDNPSYMVAYDWHVQWIVKSCD